MKKSSNIIIIGGGCLSFNSLLQATAQNQIVASEQHVIREVNVGSFDHIRQNGICDIIFTPTEGQQHLELTVPENLEDIVRVYVKDRTLVIEMSLYTSVVLNNGSYVKLRVSAPMVESITLNGSGNITFPTPVNAQKPLGVTLNGSGNIDFQNIRASVFGATVNGSGDINLGEVATARIYATVNGSGDLTLAAVNASEIHAAVNGSGDLVWQKVSSNQATLTVNGSGNIKMSDMQSQSVSASVYGSGDLELNGHTEHAHYFLTGWGDISAARLKAKYVTARTVYGSGEIHCHASESIVMAQRRNDYSIFYTGNPQRVERMDY